HHALSRVPLMCSSDVCFIMCLPSPRSTLFPYTTLFRSAPSRTLGDRSDVEVQQCMELTDTNRPRACSYKAATRPLCGSRGGRVRSEEHTSELQSRFELVCRRLLEKRKNSSVVTNVNRHA